MDWNNKEEVLKKVKENAWNLEYISDDLKNDIEGS